MKSCLKCLKLEVPELVKKNLCLVCQVTPSSSQICREVQNLAVEGGRDDHLFCMNAQNIFFSQMPKLNKYCLGLELALAHQVIGKLKMDHLWVYTLCPTSCSNRYRM